MLLEVENKDERAEQDLSQAKKRTGNKAGFHLSPGENSHHNIAQGPTSIIDRVLNLVGRVVGQPGAVI